MERSAMATMQNAIERVRESREKAGQLAAEGHGALAVAELQATLADICATEWSESAHAPSGDLREKRQLASALSEALGVFGGMQRRLGDLRDAARTFRQGRAIETTPGLGLDLSYNTVNALIVPLEAGDEVDSKQHAAEVAAAIGELERQVRGARGDDCWAKADLALCYLLGRRKAKSLEIYRNFARECPGDCIESARAVLVGLGKAFEARHDSRSEIAAKVLGILRDV
jgi:hypothetical protein